MSQPLYIASDNIVVIGPVIDRLGTLTAAQIAAATGTVTIKDSTGANLAGAVNLPIALLSGSTNRFWANVSEAATAVVVDGSDYSAYAVIWAGGVKLTLKEPLRGAYKS